MDTNNVNKRILGLCKEKGWSEYRLAAESDIPNSSINAMFKQNQTPTIYNLQKICNAFHISLSQFFDNELFRGTETPTFIALWNKLNENEREKVLIYMHGLLNLTIPEEGFKSDIQ